MRHFRIAAALVAVLLLGACAQVNSVIGGIEAAYSTVTAAQIPPAAMVAARNTFNALEVTATNYLRLPRCSGANGPVCRSPVATKVIVAAVRSGRVARNDVTAFMKAHPGQLGPSGMLDVLQSAIRALQDAYSTYKVNA